MESYWKDWISCTKFCRATANVFAATLMEFSFMYHLAIDFVPDAQIPNNRRYDTNDTTSTSVKLKN